MTDAGPDASPADSSGMHSDAGRAIFNALVVTASLVITGGVAMIVKLFLPRRLGPDLFGQYNFAEALAINAFGFIGLGIDMYMQKELPQRPGHASDFYGGTQLVRIALSLVMLPALALLASGGGYSSAVVATVLVFGLAQLLAVLANSSATVLYASRRVNRLTAINITSKLVWGAGVALALIGRASLWTFALASLLAEALRLVALVRVARSTVGLAIRIDVRQTRRALRKSAPFYLTQVAVALYGKIDVAIMGLLLPGREVGFYGAATNISNVAMLMVPVFGWVLMPQLSHAAARRDELFALMRRSLEWILVLALPVALLLGLGSDVIVRTVFGPSFAPSIDAMRVLAPQYVLIYVAMLGSVGLILLDRSWTVTIVTLISLTANAALNLWLLRPALRALGEGGAGVAASAISVATELAVAGGYLCLLGKDIVDRRGALTFLKCLAACGAVVAADLASRRLGPARLLLDAALYVALLLALRAVRVGEVIALFRAAIKHARRPADVRP